MADRNGILQLEGDNIYPKTFDYNVYNSNNESLDNVITNLQSQISTSLSYKADKSLSNVTYPSITVGSTTTGSGDRVIEQYLSSDGKTWYRKWASGWKECGIYFEATFSQSANTVRDYGDVALPISFSNIKYNVQITNVWKSSGGHSLVWDTSEDTATVSSIFLVSTNPTNTNVGNGKKGCNIYVCGY